VQPGRPGEFNDYRFPSKLPEFFAIGRPVILPASNVALEMRHLEDAYILPEATAIPIANAVRHITGDAALQARLEAGARRFFETQLKWARSAEQLRDFYEEITAQPGKNRKGNPEE